MSWRLEKLVWNLKANNYPIFIKTNTMTMINLDDYWLIRMINELAYQLPKVADVKSRARCRNGHDIRHHCDDAYRKLHLPCNERSKDHTDSVMWSYSTGLAQLLVSELWGTRQLCNIVGPCRWYFDSSAT